MATKGDILRTAKAHGVAKAADTSAWIQALNRAKGLVTASVRAGAPTPNADKTLRQAWAILLDTTRTFGRTGNFDRIEYALNQARPEPNQPHYAAFIQDAVKEIDRAIMLVTAGRFMTVEEYRQHRG